MFYNIMIVSAIASAIAAVHFTHKALYVIGPRRLFNIMYILFHYIRKENATQFSLFIG